MYLGCASCGLAGLTPEEISARHTFLIKQLHALALAINQAKQRGDVAGVRNLLPRYQQVANEYRALGATDLTGVDRFILTTGQWVADSAAAAKDLLKDAAGAGGAALGAAITPLIVPLIVIGGALLFAKSKGIV